MSKIISNMDIRQYQTAFNNIDGLALVGVQDYADNNHWINLLQINSEAYGQNRE